MGATLDVEGVELLVEGTWKKLVFSSGLQLEQNIESILFRLAYGKGPSQLVYILFFN